jgi:hypothetical protein
MALDMAPVAVVVAVVVPAPVAAVVDVVLR